MIDAVAAAAADLRPKREAQPQQQQQQQAAARGAEANCATKDLRNATLKRQLYYSCTTIVGTSYSPTAFADAVPACLPGSRQL